MNISEAIDFVRNHHLTALKRSTNTAYELFFKSLKAFFGDRALESITAAEIGKFLESFTARVARGTRHVRYAQTKAFFSLISIAMSAPTFFLFTNICLMPAIVNDFE